MTQFVLGAAVGEAVIGKQVGRKALLWGGLLATVPDLDVFVPLGDAVKDFTYHRSASHSLILLALVTPLFVWLINRIHPQYLEFKTRWMIMVYLVFSTHVILDCFTVYGTQIFWPLSEMPVAWSTIFIIDPLYALFLLIGIVVSLIVSRNRKMGFRINHVGLILSSIYLMWTVSAKFFVQTNFETALKNQNIEYDRIFTTPSPFNSLLWRAVVMHNNVYYEAFYSVLDKDNHINFNDYVNQTNLLKDLENKWTVQRLKWFSKGFYGVKTIDNHIIMSDLRMGVEPDYAFQFKIAQIDNPHPKMITPEHIPPNWSREKLKLIWQRIWQKNDLL